MTSIVISGSGLYTPPFAVSNEALVAAFNQYVDLYNEENASAIDAGQLPAKQHSSCEFIEKASGIKSRYLVSSEGCWIPTSCNRSWRSARTISPPSWWRWRWRPPSRR